MLERQESGRGLRDGLEKLLERYETYNEDWYGLAGRELRDLLAAHPGEPAQGARHNLHHPVGPRSMTGVHHADGCPMRDRGASGCICGREGERATATTEGVTQ